MSQPGEAGGKSSALHPAARKALFSGAATVLVIQGSGYSSRYLMQVLLARWIGSTGYGDYSYALALAQVLAVVAGLGLPVAVIRFIPAYRAHGATALMHGLMTRGRQLTLAASVVLALLGSAILFWAPPQRLGLWALVFGLWTCPFLALSNLEGEALRVFDRIALYSMPVAAAPILIIAFAAVLLGFHRLDGASATAAQLVAFALISGWQWGALRSAAGGAQIVRSYTTREWLRSLVPFLLLSAGAILLVRVDVLILGAMKGAAAAGVYAAAASSATLVSTLLQAMNTRGAVMMSERLARKDYAGLERVILEITRWSFWPSCAFGAALIALRAPLLRLFGADFASAQWPLVILVAGQVVNAATGPIGYLMIISGNERLTVNVIGWCIAAAVVGDLILVPRFGASGAAVMSSATLIAWNLVLFAQAHSRAGVRVWWPWTRTRPLAAT
ncbi:MAG: lipopolysaccharide biosynthesis protein [Candidatus Binataceae bacterium]